MVRHNSLHIILRCFLLTIVVPPLVLQSPSTVVRVVNTDLKSFSPSTLGNKPSRAQYRKRLHFSSSHLLICSYLQRILRGFTIQKSTDMKCMIKYVITFVLLAVNFRGSLGFGQASLHTLPGNIGTQDVQDVMVSWNILLIISIIIVRTVSRPSNN